MTQETQSWYSVTTSRGGMGWEVGSRGRGHMYTYSQLMLMYGKMHEYIIVLLL